MEALIPWLTPALIVAMVAVWLRSDLRDTRQETWDMRGELNGRIDVLAAEMSKRFDEMNRRLDGVSRELAEQRRRMAKLEDSLEGFLAGRRDRDAA